MANDTCGVRSVHGSVVMQTNHERPLEPTLDLCIESDLKSKQFGQDSSRSPFCQETANREFWVFE